MDHSKAYVRMTKKTCRKKKREREREREREKKGAHDLKVLEDMRKQIQEMKQENSIQWLMG